MTLTQIYNSEGSRAQKLFDSKFNEYIKWMQEFFDYTFSKIIEPGIKCHHGSDETRFVLEEYYASIRLTRSIYYLAQMGQIKEAYLLLRALLEKSLNIKYVYHENEFSKQYLNLYYLRIVHMRDQFEKHVSLENREKHDNKNYSYMLNDLIKSNELFRKHLLTQVRVKTNAELIDRIKNKQWNGISVNKTATKVGMSEHYKIVYSHLSSFQHFGQTSNPVIKYVDFQRGKYRPLLVDAIDGNVYETLLLGSLIYLATICGVFKDRIIMEDDLRSKFKNKINHFLNRYSNKMALLSPKESTQKRRLINAAKKRRLKGKGIFN